MKFIIEGRLPGLNDIMRASLYNRFAYGKLKKTETARCAMAAITGGVFRFRHPVKISITWYEKNAKRDIDNVAAGIKFIADGLVESGKLENDTRYWIREITHHFPSPDPIHPRVEVEIHEIDSV